MVACGWLGQAFGDANGAEAPAARVLAAALPSWLRSRLGLTGVELNEHMAEVLASLVGLPRLAMLQLQGCALERLPGVAAATLKAGNALTALRELRLDANNFDPQDMDRLRMKMIRLQDPRP